MRNYKYVRVTVAIAAIFVAITNIPGASAEQLRLGVMPFVSAEALFDQFRHLRDYLQRELRVSVTIESAPDLETFVQRLSDHRYDIAFTAPHLAVLAASNIAYKRLANAAYKPIAGRTTYTTLVRTPPTTATVYVRADSNLFELADLSGQTVATPDRLALVTLLAEAALAANPTIRPAAKIQHTPSHNNALLLVADGTADAAISVPPVHARMPASIRNRLRAIGTLGDMFSVIYLVAPHLDANLVARLEQRLLAFSDTEEGRRFGSAQLDRATPSDLEPFREFEPTLRARIGSGLPG